MKMKKSVLIALAAVLCFAACKKEVPAPEGTVEAVAAEQQVPYWGGELKYTVTSNCNWMVGTREEKGLSFNVIDGGSGTTELVVSVPKNTTRNSINWSFLIKFENSDGLTDSKTVSFEQPAPSLEYGGVTYKVVYLQDGNYWMAENLRYVPEGKTVSEDLKNIANGIWYPVNTDGTNALFDKTESYVNECGYLYTASVAFGAEVTASNFDKFAGTRGICPEGWHIPTFEECFALIGHTSNSKVYPDDPKAPYYDADLKYGSIAKMAADGMTLPIPGLVNVSSATATAGALVGPTGKAPEKTMNTAYILGSTSYQKTDNTDGSLKNIQYYSIMPSKNNGTLNVAYSSYRSGCSVRCVRDADK